MPPTWAASPASAVLGTVTTRASSFSTRKSAHPQTPTPPWPTADLDHPDDKVYKNMTGLVKAVMTMSSKIQPAPPQEYVLTEREVGLALQTLLATVAETVRLPAGTHRQIKTAQKLLNSSRTA